jgi:hypothetical protein
VRKLQVRVRLEDRERVGFLAKWVEEVKGSGSCLMGFVISGVGTSLSAAEDFVTLYIYIYILADPANVVLPYKLFLGNFLV